MEKKFRKSLSDEAIIAALIAEGTVKGAAISLGCTERTLYKRMKAPAFQEMYAAARADILKTATSKLQGQLCKAVDTLVEIMEDRKSPQQTRVNAASTILLYGARFTESTDLLARLEALESLQKAVS